MNKIISQIRKCNDAQELLCGSLEIKKQLIDIGVASNLTDPVGNYAEYLVLQAFGGEKTGNGTAGCDLIDRNGRKIEVKGRVKKHSTYKPKTYINDSNVSNKKFDYLVYIVFDNDFNIEYAFGVTNNNFKKLADYVEHKNSPPKWKIKVKEEILKDKRIDDLTQKILKTQRNCK